MFVLGDTKIVNGDKEASGDEDEEEAIFYDKAKSFFDNISCDATEQARGCGIYVLLWSFEKLQLVFMETYVHTGQFIV